MPQTVIPQLRITNSEQSLGFYVNGLGFKIDWQHRFGPRYPLFVQLTRQGQTIFLTEHMGDCEVGGAVYFIVQDAGHTLSEFEQHGVVATNPLSNTSWGTSEFLLTDPDGNRLRFASELQQQT
ncbi:putative glyoxalase superfamily protein PhnB [Fluviicoccus keumensis]|uniref:Bleomycin resistance protein n=1 Tax=Fluviicoccus keumensis TaxID=1435465 RepID=A0A4Q7YPB4_9GAMM|nr:VOC family protein [Fluviicoccus keumensis]RZU38691.1 putative glyoxalase superfamily protein PhnB [Fluviicoccus keumensis]